MPEYSNTFFATRNIDVFSSARAIVPELLRLYRPNSVIDVGCGIGTWLAVFAEYGVADISGVDGPWVDPKMLLIPSDRFRHSDLNGDLKSNRRFDLAISLEVAEHLSPDKAVPFVCALTQLSDVVLFSAAIPFQGGNAHINEQWQDYWADLFRERGYVPVDCIRHTIWENPDVAWWYAQNALVYVKKDCLSKYPLLEVARASTSDAMLRLVHPRKYVTVTDPAYRSVLSEAKRLAQAISRGVRNRVGRLSR